MPCHVSQCQLSRPHRADATGANKQCDIYRVATLETGLKQKQQELNQMHEQLDALQVKRFADLHHHSCALMHLSNPVPAARWIGQEASILPEAKRIVLSCVQAVVKRRDGEIQRLAARAEKGPDANQMNLRFKNETNESIILQLNSQVSRYGARLSRPENSLYLVAASVCWFASLLQSCCTMRLMQGQQCRSQPSTVA